jgi:hypothetical protein
VRDGVLLRLIGKWLKAGVVEDGSVSYPDSGSPQGGVVSPLLSNIFLHYVLDLWFEREVKPRLRDRAFLIRYADDVVIGFRDGRDAQRVLEVLPNRFGKIAENRPKLRGRLTCWVSPTFGPALGKATGSSSRRRRTTASAAQCGALMCGARLTGIGRLGSSRRSSTRSFVGITGTMASRATPAPYHGFSMKSGDDGTSGSIAGTVFAR